MKKAISFVLAVLITGSLLTGCGNSSSSSTAATSDKPVELSMNVTTSESSVWQVAANEFKEKVEAGTNGRYIINVYPNEQLSSGDMVKGVEPLAFGENGFRQITNNEHAITSPADLKGLKIRTPAITMYVDMFKLLGADPTSMSFSEVYTACSRGPSTGRRTPTTLSAAARSMKFRSI